MPLEQLDDRWRMTARVEFVYDVIPIWDLLSSPVATATDILGGPECAAGDRSRLVGMDVAVWDLYGARWDSYFKRAGIKAELLLIKAGEPSKDDESVRRVMRAMVKANVTPLKPPIGVGGGVVHDILGHAVNRLYRGIVPWVFVGTTAVAIFDAAYGGKVGVNAWGIKNLDGGFYPPQRVFLDPSFLRTVSERHISNGVAELFKVGLMVQPELLGILLTHGQDLVRKRFQPDDELPMSLIWDVIKLGDVPMLEEQAENMRVGHKRRWPEFGHDCCKRWEMLAVDRLLHGEAVAMNMATQVMVSNGRGLLSDARRDGIIDGFQRAGLRIYDPVMEERSAIEEGLRGAADLREGGQAIPVPVDDDEFEAAGPIGATRCEFLDDIAVGEAVQAIAGLREWTNR